MWPFRPRKAQRQASPSEPPCDAAILGREGEQLAGRFLRSQGLTILAANYRCPVGEADLIALDPSTTPALGCETLVFVEVKTRTAGQLTTPELAVNAHKQSQMHKVARYYRRVRKARDLAVRYDIVAITVQDGCPPRLKHIVGAF